MIFNSGKLKKGFTLIELMVVLFIVGILSAVAIPFMKGRTDASKWTEGKAIAGTIRTAARAFIGEKGNFYVFETAKDNLPTLGFAAGDLSGRFFKDGDYTIEWTDNGTDTPDYLVTVTSSRTGEAPLVPDHITIDQDGLLTEF